MGGVLYRIEPLMMRDRRGAGHRADIASEAVRVVGRICCRVPCLVLAQAVAEVDPVEIRGVELKRFGPGCALLLPMRFAVECDDPELWRQLAEAAPQLDT